MSSLSLHATTSLQPTLSPRLQRAVRLLQMSSQDFAQVVRDALDTNPFLEPEETAPRLMRLTRPTRTPLRSTPWKALAKAGASMASIACATPRTTAGFSTRWRQATSLADHLLGQLNVMPLPERDRMLAAVVVESLDDDGYLRTPPEELGQAC